MSKHVKSLKNVHVFVTLYSYLITNYSFSVICIFIALIAFHIKMLLLTAKVFYDKKNVVNYSGIHFWKKISFLCDDELIEDNWNLIVL